MNYFVICDCLFIATPGKPSMAPDGGDDGRTCSACHAPIRAYRMRKQPVLMDNGRMLMAGATIEPIVLDVHERRE